MSYIINNKSHDTQHKFNVNYWPIWLTPTPIPFISTISQAISLWCFLNKYNNSS